MRQYVHAPNRQREANGRGTAAKRVAIINPHPIQYFAPLYAYLSAAEGIDLTVLYCTDHSLRAGRATGFGQSFVWDVDLLDGYRSVFLGSRARTRTPAGFLSLIVPEVWKELGSGKYDAVVVHGHRYAANWLAVAAAKRFGVKVMMRSETHLGLRRPWWVRSMRKATVGSLYRLCDQVLAIGTANARFYREMGVAEQNIALVPYAVDNERFGRASRLSSSERSGELAALGVSPHRPVVLYASKFQRRKHPDDVVRAAAELTRRGAEFTLLMVGDGEMRVELERLARDLGLENVVFAGFINQRRLPTIYGISDVFVLPSESEPWGLIVNEVMCAGLPVVVAHGVGCVEDLVVHGENGFLFEVGDVAGLAAALQPLLSSPELRRRMGQRSREIVARWSYEQCLEGLRHALRRL
jgi:glycosyltransferase involved in cell wall biosynthesis